MTETPAASAPQTIEQVRDTILQQIHALALSVVNNEASYSNVKELALAYATIATVHLPQPPVVNVNRTEQDPDVVLATMKRLLQKAAEGSSAPGRREYKPLPVNISPNAFALDEGLKLITQYRGLITDSERTKIADHLRDAIQQLKDRNNNTRVSVADVLFRCFVFLVVGDI